MIRPGKGERVFVLLFLNFVDQRKIAATNMAADGGDKAGGDVGILRVRAAFATRYRSEASLIYLAVYERIWMKTCKKRTLNTTYSW